MENNNSNWQRCPVCGGSGIGYSIYGSSYCGTCGGHGIISTLSGAPPQYKKFMTGTTINMPNQDSLNIENVPLSTDPEDTELWSNSETISSIPKENNLKLAGFGPSYAVVDLFCRFNRSPVAVFKHIEHANKFGEIMYNGWFKIEEVQTDIFDFKK